MSSQIPVPVQTSNMFEDLSGISTAAFDNPYDALIAASHDNTVCALV